MAPTIKRVALLGATAALAAGAVLATAAPAQAWCTQQTPNGVVHTQVCGSGYCHVDVRRPGLHLPVAGG